MVLAVSRRILIISILVSLVLSHCCSFLHSEAFVIVVSVISKLLQVLLDLETIPARFDAHVIAHATFLVAAYDKLRYLFIICEKDSVGKDDLAALDKPLCIFLRVGYQVLDKPLELFICRFLLFPFVLFVGISVSLVHVILHLSHILFFEGLPFINLRFAHRAAFLFLIIRTSTLALEEVDGSRFEIDKTFERPVGTKCLIW